jgi:hypothetical protein
VAPSGEPARKRSARRCSAAKPRCGLWAHRHCTPVRLSLCGRSCQFGRMLASMMPQRVSEAVTMDLPSGVAGDNYGGVGSRWRPGDRAGGQRSRFRSAPGPSHLRRRGPTPTFRHLAPLGTGRRSDPIEGRRCVGRCRRRWDSPSPINAWARPPRSWSARPAAPAGRRGHISQDRRTLR